MEHCDFSFSFYYLFYLGGEISEERVSIRPTLVKASFVSMQVLFYLGTTAEGKISRSLTY